MSRPKIKTALISIFLLIAIIVGGFAAYSVNRLQVVNHNVSELAEHWMPNLRAATYMSLNLANLRIGYRDHVLAPDEAGMARTEAKITEFRNQLLQNLNRYDALDSDKTDGTFTVQIVSDLKTYTTIGEKVIALSRKTEKDEARKVLYTELFPAQTAIVESVDKLIEINAKGASDVYASSQAVFSTSLVMALVAIAISFAVIVGSIWFALSGIAKPIETITSAMKNLAAGDSALAIPYGGRSDEIGEMAAAVEVFRSNAVLTKRLEDEAEANRGLSDDERRRKAEIDRAKSEQMTQATSGLADGLKHLAGGDLSFKLAQPFAAEFEALRSDFNVAIGQLSGTLRSVAEATGAIDKGSREVSASANDLSKRTEQQAASLEGTAAALDEITVNVANSSKRADEARTAALQANESAAQSGKVVANAIDAMQRIEQSSNEISNIIGVIDEIAFQTNLLALNAGVEAARAGDAGKGFAVVAQEVRELAQRSAKAAKEIKELIRNSSAEVQSGVKLVSDTGEALKTIGAYIVTVNRHMDSIATSAREQAVGLGEVNTAVNQMDQVTQQNAAMVEDASAAGATLAHESNRLRELIAQFDLGAAGADLQTAALRQTATTMAANISIAKAGRPPYGNAAIKQNERVQR